MSQFLKPVIVIALYALLLPVMGPLLDHHYVEWQHNHAHVFFGDPAGHEGGRHLHVYDSGVSHDHLASHILASGQVASGGIPARTSPPEGVAYLSGYDGSGNGPIFAPTGPAGQSLCFGGPDTCPLLLAYDASQTVPVGALVAPPGKPPPA